jgi:hypothetical protein
MVTFSRQRVLTVSPEASGISVRPVRRIPGTANAHPTDRLSAVTVPAMGLPSAARTRSVTVKRLCNVDFAD